MNCGKIRSVQIFHSRASIISKLYKDKGVILILSCVWNLVDYKTTIKENYLKIVLKLQNLWFPLFLL